MESQSHAPRALPKLEAKEVTLFSPSRLMAPYSGKGKVLYGNGRGTTIHPPTTITV